MRDYGKRGVPIGAYISQPLGNFGLTGVDHYMKEVMGSRGYYRYSDDTVGFARTKGEARRHLREFIFLTERGAGLVVKSNIQLMPLRDGKTKRRHRRRQRGKGRRKP